jgi:NAD(P)-dependent dehydrogenase (short-subunit alcohol dehydrogenase family)
VLWNNAGTGAGIIPDGSKTEQGLEAFVGMHCVAPLLLTELLLPLLQKAASTPPLGSEAQQMPRVIWAASHLSDRFAAPGGMDFEVLNKGGYNDGMLDYSASKAGNWLLAHELSLRHPELISVALNPGNLDTDAFSGISPLLRSILRWTVLHTATDGAHTELFAGLSPEVGPEQNGMYIVPWGRIWGDDVNTRKDVLKALKKKEDGGEEVGRRFWEWCEEQFKNAENR